MRIPITCGRERIDLTVREDQQVNVRRQPAAPPLADPVAAVRAALAAPRNFPPLRQALTPDDHLVIVADDTLGRLPDLLSPILDYLKDAGIPQQDIQVLCPAARQPLTDDWRRRYGDVRLEVHDPADRRKLSYLAATRYRRRVYLNRSAVDADQLIVLSRRGYDPILGYSGAEGALFPALSDEATQQASFAGLTMAVPQGPPSKAKQETQEVAWLLGVPFLVQIIEGAGDEIVHVLAGPPDSSAAGEELLDARWRMQVERRPSLVVAGLAGDPARPDFAALARAVACAERVVRSQGKIVLLCQSGPELGVGAKLILEAAEAEQALKRVRKLQPADAPAAFQWLSAALHAHLYVLSAWPSETIEELFATPLENPRQVQRLIDRDESCLILDDADKTMAVLD